MDPTRTSRRERDEHRPRKSRSPSFDSEERRGRRRRERPEEKDERPGDRRSKHDDGERKRRRSRSPKEEFSRRRRDDDRGSKHRSTRERSPRHRDGRDGKDSREDSATQLSRKNKGPLPSQEASFQSNNDPSGALVPAGELPEKQKPNFAPSGLLAAASNSFAQADGTTIALKYHEPPEARKPPTKDVWKLFVFKGSEIVETIELSLRSCWLVGRELAVVDMPAEHPKKKNEFGDKLGRVRPYLIDLESANGTSLNKEEVPPSRYLELRDKDMIQFGHSTREYVLMMSPKG
ncbi:Smad nuclear-interacting protein [Lachnellula hyalina]|uniref:Smad nuclear-interacting protein n=1 Tax=Lachnellula hyalina TaxID=1316788 RepID=A0A8H8RB52_9HELO|nr:Smad nuclear-interacting protein [Lachnellula hyalina]TVY30909.1 Smad nuclear-interacting protein [Lachnellula hyalina]